MSLANAALPWRFSRGDCGEEASEARCFSGGNGILFAHVCGFVMGEFIPPELWAYGLANGGWAFARAGLLQWSCVWSRLNWCAFRCVGTLFWAFVQSLCLLANVAWSFAQADAAL